MPRRTDPGARFLPTLARRDSGHRDIAPDGYPAVRPQPTGDGAGAADVYPYICDGALARLCLSCAVRRRMRGQTVKMAGDGAADGECEDCGGNDV